MATSIETRLAKLERSARYWRLAAITAVLTALVFWAVKTPAGNANGDFDVVKARWIIVSGTDGTSIQIGSKEGEAGIYISGANKVAGAALTVNDGIIDNPLHVRPHSDLNVSSETRPNVFDRSVLSATAGMGGDLRMYRDVHGVSQETFRAPPRPEPTSQQKGQ